MSQRDTIIRSMHDLGLATWFGGSLMGAVGLNGATAAAEEPQERARLAALGWKRWAPVVSAAIGVHAIGGSGLIVSQRGRVENQDGAAANTAIKTGLTIVAAGLSVYSGILGRKVEELSGHGAEGATEPASGAPHDLAAAQKQLKITQWAIPAVTGILVVLGAQQGEQQKPTQQLISRLGIG